jgi:hypothetical protein
MSCVSQKHGSAHTPNMAETTKNFDGRDASASPDASKDDKKSAQTFPAAQDTSDDTWPVG